MGCACAGVCVRRPAKSHEAMAALFTIADLIKLMSFVRGNARLGIAREKNGQSKGPRRVSPPAVFNGRLLHPQQTRKGEENPEE